MPKTGGNPERRGGWRGRRVGRRPGGLVSIYAKKKEDHPTKKNTQKHTPSPGGSISRIPPVKQSSVQKDLHVKQGVVTYATVAERRPRSLYNCLHRLATDTVTVCPETP